MMQDPQPGTAAFEHSVHLPELLSGILIGAVISWACVFSFYTSTGEAQALYVLASHRVATQAEQLCVSRLHKLEGNLREIYGGLPAIGP